MGFLSSLFGGGGFEKMPTMTKEQEGLLNQIMQQLGGGGQLGQQYGQALGGLEEFMDPSSEAMQRFADPYMRQFEQQTIPGIAERFAGAGSGLGGSLSSSGFGQALGAAGGNLQSQLASMKTGLQRQAIGDIMSQYGGMTGKALGARPFGYQAPQQGLIPQMLTSYAGAGFPGIPGMQQGQGFARLFGQGRGGGGGAARGGGSPYFQSGTPFRGGY